MKKVLVFAGSNSRNSINKQLATYASQKLKNCDIHIVDLNDYPLPIFSIDIENGSGIPQVAKEFDRLLEGHDGVLLSLAEHNGSYSAVFKNLLDWLSRLDGKCFRSKPMLLMSTSPGGRGGKGVLSAALDRFPRHGAQIIAHFSLPSFYDNYSGDGVGDFEASLNQAIDQFSKALN